MAHQNPLHGHILERASFWRNPEAGQPKFRVLGERVGVLILVVGVVRLTGLVRSEAPALCFVVSWRF